MSRQPVRRVLLLASCAAALIGCGPADEPPTPAAAPPSGSAGGTFGRQPCGKLVSMEEIAAAIGERPTLIDIVAEGECNYENGAGQVVLAVALASGSCGAPDREPVSGIGDAATWSAGTSSLCFVKGDKRVTITLGTRPADPKGVATGLATRAAQRVS